jgi:hypothetical protein
MSPRLAHLQQRHRIRALTVNQRAFGRFARLPPEGFDASRMVNSSGKVSLDVFVILFDIASLTGAPIETSRDSLLPNAQSFLALFEPKKLVIQLDRGMFHDGSELSDYVSIEAARAIADWRQLREIHLESLNLLVKSEGVERGIFFYNPSLSGSTHRSTSKTITWDLSAWPHLPKWNSANLLEHLIKRDGVMRQTWVESFTVILGSAELGAEFQAQIETSKRKVPSCLRWEVIQNNHSAFGTTVGHVRQKVIS